MCSSFLSMCSLGWPSCTQRPGSLSKLSSGGVSGRQNDVCPRLRDRELSFRSAGVNLCPRLTGDQAGKLQRSLSVLLAGAHTTLGQDSLRWLEDIWILALGLVLIGAGLYWLWLAG